MSTHAKLSPSSADRWTLCLGSVALSEGLPEGSSYSRDEGVAAHLLMATCLREGTLPKGYKGLTIIVDSADGDAYFVDHVSRKGLVFTIDDEMVAAVSKSVNHVRARIKAFENAGAKATLDVERKVPIAQITGEEKAEGTIDVLIIAEFPDGTTKISVEDLKYGRGVEVSAEENKQLTIYALGAIDDLSLIHNITAVDFVIHQPRVKAEPDIWSPTLEGLHEIRWRIGSLAAAAWVALSRKDRVDTLQWQNDYLHESEKACMFCKAKATCPKLTGRVSEELAKEFTDLTTASAPARKDLVKAMMPAIDQLGAKMDAIPLIEDWCKAIRAAAETELLAGRPVAGYKLVQGRQGNRMWADPAAVEGVLKAMRLKSALRLAEDPIYERTLISPTQCEKLLSSESPKRWAKVAKLITRTEGKPSVAPITDPRPELSIAIEAEFTKIEDTIDDLL